MKKIVKKGLLYIGILLLAGIFIFGMSILISVVRFNYRLNKVVESSHLQSDADRQSSKMPSRKASQSIRILSLSGGGIQGLMQLEVLNYIEQQTGETISNLFDYAGCISTGCLNLSLLLYPSATSPNQPKYNIKDLMQRYPQLVSQFLEVPWYHSVMSLNGILLPKYSAELKRALLYRILGNIRLNQLLIPVYMCTTHFKTLTPNCFQSWDDRNKNILLYKIVNASSSPPAFFYPARLNDDPYDDNMVRDTQVVDDVYFDGVIYANDPALAMLLEAHERYPNKRIIFVDIGSIPSRYELTHKSIHWGPIQWFVNIFNVLYFARENTSKEVIQFIVNHTNSNVKYFYFEGYSEKNIPPLSQKKKYVEMVRQAGLNLIKAHKKQLDQLVELLKTETHK